MARRLSHGRTKVTILVDEPDNPRRPSASELNDGHDASCDLRMNGFNFSAQASETADTTKLCNRATATTPTQRQHIGEAVVERGFDSDGEFDDEGSDETAQIVLDNIDANVWVYVRENGKWSTEEWDSGDEYRIGGEWTVDVPERGELDDNIKFTARFLPQDVHDYGRVSGSSNGGGGGGDD